ncbi:MAG: DNA topoisomerase IV subunit A [Alphaproteobacteria bacterium]|nr:DNA topoisomerase IV subunit A [Alphaproteobacteria bacterium]
MSKPSRHEDIRPVALAEALSERYLSYALSTITARSLPDARDGLKPVHRRLLYAMLQLRLDPAAGFKKCARVVGDVIGKFHPHGDQAVYDALVRMAQGFAVRYPLVDGQGNFGNVDGDNAAAMRYTEARLTPVAGTLLDGIDQDTVDFRATYDGTEQEPVVLPGAFPNLLANGATGIAVGMATSIPPHNAGEVCDAALHLIEHKGATVADLLAHMPGPDFPTGGVLVEDAATLQAAYESGRGSFRVRARWTVERLKHGLYQIIVTEIPYQVQKARLVEQIASLLAERRLALLADVRDESTDEIRLVLEPRNRNVAPEQMIEQMFRATELESRFPLNMNVLDGGRVPRVMNLVEVLRAFLDHRHEVLVRRSNFRLRQIVDRLEVLGGLLAAYLNLDAVIKIIREEDEPKALLQRRLELSERQAEAILNMRLRHLRKLEEQKIREEHAALTREQRDLERLLKDGKRRWRVIGDEIRDLRQRFGGKTPAGKRRTEIAAAPAPVAVPVAALIDREPITVVCSEKGWIKAIKGHLPPVEVVRYKEGDQERFRLHAETTDRLMVFATDGRFYTLNCAAFPPGRGHGDPIRLLIDLANDQDMVAIHTFQGGRKLLVASTAGKGFLVEEEQAVAQTRAGRQVLNLTEGAEAKVCAPVTGDTVAVLGENRKLLMFDLAELPTMARGQGVTLQRYKEGWLGDAITLTLADGLAWTSGGRTRTERDLRPWLGKRGQAGRLPPTGFPRGGRLR